jgi:hypothetical protein|tara:strand:+ start:843 stop:1061 length:219 start_codon:yes stop_codon:yes gene_type:complete
LIEERKPVEELAFILEKFGWNTKFCDLTEDQVYTLIFGLQAAKDISSEIEIGKLEENYFKSTGTWPPTSIPF